MHPDELKARNPNAVSIEYPNGRRLKSSASYRRSGGNALVFFVVGLLIGATTLAAGFWLGGAGRTAPPPPDGGSGTFTLRALISGFLGVGGAIDGQRNPTLTVDMDDEVTIILIGGEAVEHNIAIDEFTVHSAHVRAVNEQVTVTFTADQEGTFAYYCEIAGHRQAGMKGDLVVGTGHQTGPGPVRPVDVPEILRDPTDVPPPIARSTPATVHIWLETREVIAYIESDTTSFTYWTFNGTVPGPFFRVRVNDTVVVHFRNAVSSTMEHSVDFHAVTGPGGGMAATAAMPGVESGFTFKAINAGIFVYHCASAHIPTHISSGMYGLILVEPEGGLPAVDHEFYVMQGDIYTKWPAGTAGHQEFDGEAMNAEAPTYVVFNGKYRGLTGANALTANVNETVRIYFGVGGPNLVSSFHVIGEIFDYVYAAGDLESPPQRSVQTTLVAPGGAAAVEFKVEVPGNYILVDHSLSRTIDKGSLAILVVTGPDNPDIFDP